MNIRFSSYLLSLLVLVLILPGCKKVYDENINSRKGVFNFSVTEVQQKRINESRGEQFIVSDPLPELHYNGDLYTIDRFEIRGESSLNFNRK